VADKKCVCDLEFVVLFYSNTWTLKTMFRYWKTKPHSIIIWYYA